MQICFLPLIFVHIFDQVLIIPSTTTTYQPPIHQHKIIFILGITQQLLLLATPAGIQVDKKLHVGV